MKRFLAYFRYVMRHRREVRKACWRVGLFWRGLVHDLSKYSPSEFFPYARQFYNADGSKRDVRDKTGYYDPNTQPDDFKSAWRHHWTHNDHHWEWWARIKLGTQWVDRTEPLEMSRKAVLEMMCDWWGAGRAQNSAVYPDEWWTKNNGSMRLHKNTRALIRENIEPFVCFQMFPTAYRFVWQDEWVVGNGGESSP